MTTKTKTIKTVEASELKARSIEINKSAKTLGKEVHTHLMHIAKHIAMSRDTTLATHFVTLLMNKDAEGESRSIVRADAVKNWLEAFAFCVWGKQKDGKEGFKLRSEALANIEDTHFATAAANPWNEYTKAKPFAIFDLDKAIEALIKRAEEKQGEECPEGKAHKIAAAKLEALKALAE